MSFFNQLEVETKQDREALFSIPIIQDALRGEIKLHQYLAFLKEAYHHVKHTVPLLTACKNQTSIDYPWLKEAMAEYIHKRIRSELGFGHEDDRDIKKLLKQGYRGSRYSFGYPACPKLEDQALLLKLLEADKIGVELSEEFQLHPEQSTSAIVVHHPQAKYFNI